MPKQAKAPAPAPLSAVASSSSAASAPMAASSSSSTATLRHRINNSQKAPVIIEESDDPMDIDSDDALGDGPEDNDVRVIGFNPFRKKFTEF